MLFSTLLRGSLLYVPNVGAQPEPPVRFNVNVQGLVGVLNRVKGVENRSIAQSQRTDLQGDPAARGRGDQEHGPAVLNDLIALDADRRGREFLFVSRGANYAACVPAVGQGRQAHILDAANKATRASRRATCRAAL